MNDQPNDLLLLSGKMLTILLQIALAIGAIAIAIGAPLMLFFKDEVAIRLGEEVTNISGDTFVATTLGLMVIAFGIITLAYLFFGKLRAIIGSVAEGDPFAPENAKRIHLMAWLMLGAQLLMIPALSLSVLLEGWAKDDRDAAITLHAGLDIEGILMVITLFILARVFKHGANMRDDLEGTI